MVDKGPVGPSAGDFQGISQTVQIIGLTSTQGSLQLGAEGTLTGAIVLRNPGIAQANLSLRLAAGLIRVSGWLGPGETGPPTSYLLLAHGWGGLLTDSRGQVVIYDDGGGDGGGTPSDSRARATKLTPPPPGTDFSIFLR